MMVANKPNDLIEKLTMILKQFGQHRSVDMLKDEQKTNETTDYDFLGDIKPFTVKVLRPSREKKFQVC